jgi:hypothetical protein
MAKRKKRTPSTESNDEPKATETETQLVWLLRVLACVFISTGQHKLDADTLDQQFAAIGSSIQTYCHGIVKGEYADSIEISTLLQQFLEADNTVQFNVTEPANKRKKLNATVSLTKQGLLVTGTTYFLVPVRTEKSNGKKPHYLYVRFKNTDLEQFQIILNSGLPTDQNTVKSIDDLESFLRDKCGLRSAVLHDVPGDGHCWYYMFLQLILCDVTKREPTEQEQLLSLELYLKCMLSRALDLRHKTTHGHALKKAAEQAAGEASEKLEKAGLKQLKEDMSLTGLCIKVQETGNLEFFMSGFFGKADTNLFANLVTTVTNNMGAADSDIVMMTWMELNSQNPGSVSELVDLAPYRSLINGFGPLITWLYDAENDTRIDEMYQQVPNSRQEYVSRDPDEVRRIVREAAIKLTGGSDSTHGGDTFWQWQCHQCRHWNANTLNACGNCERPVGKK